MRQKEEEGGTRADKVPLTTPGDASAHSICAVKSSGKPVL